jgi:3-oxoacyl-[acyl-carrier-protein] synthase III
MNKMIAAITGVHGYVPDYILTNAELEKLVETNDDWITSRTGIKERRILKGDHGTSYLGIEAVKGLLAKTNTDPSEIDLLICATVTPDHTFPATSNLIAEGVGIRNIGSYDLAAACSGFVNALATGAMCIESGRMKKVVVVGADKMSAIVDYTDRTTCVLFGDGAGAVLLEPSQEEGVGIQDFLLKSDGSGAQYLIQKNGGSRYPLNEERLAERQHFIHQEGPSVFKFAVTRMADVAAEIMERNQLQGDDVAWLVPHQANKRIIDATANRMNIGPEKVMLNIQKYGNTTAATIPLCLWDYEEQLRKGDNLILAAFGGGFTWASAYVKWAY